MHRDLKPENIFLTRTGATKILDFGIAKLADGERRAMGVSTFTGIVLGTLGYLAPEQIRGGAIDRRADLFALGAIVFEMLTGGRAFARDHTVDTLHAILHEPPPERARAAADVPPASPPSFDGCSKSRPTLASNRPPIWFRHWRRSPTAARPRRAPATRGSRPRHESIDADVMRRGRGRPPSPLAIVLAVRRLVLPARSSTRADARYRDARDPSVSEPARQ